MFYYELIHIHQDKCRHARRFWSPLAGSEPVNHAFIAYLRVPSPRPGVNLNLALVEDASTSGALEGGGGC